MALKFRLLVSILLLPCSFVGRAGSLKLDEGFRFSDTAGAQSEHYGFDLKKTLESFMEYSKSHVDGHVFLGLTFLTLTLATITFTTTACHRAKMVVRRKKEECLFREWVYWKSEQNPVELAEELMELVIRHPELTGHTMFGKLMSQGVFLPVGSESGSEGSDILKRMRRDMVWKRPLGDSD